MTPPIPRAHRIDRLAQRFVLGLLLVATLVMMRVAVQAAQRDDGAAVARKEEGQ